MAASPATDSMERKVENLRAFVVKFARSKRLLLPEPKLLEQKLLDLCSSGTPDHPAYGAMIHEAITELNEARGSSEEGISEFIKSKYKDLPHAHTSLLSHNLAKLMDKEEILRNCDDCYMLPTENTAAYVDDKRKVEMKSGSPGCVTGINNWNGAKREDQSKVVQNLVTEAITNQKEEENVKILQYEEHKVQNAGNFPVEQDSIITQGETHAEIEASGAILRSEKLEVGDRDQTLEQQRLIAEAQLLAGQDENTDVMQSGEVEHRDVWNFELLVEEKEKQERCEEYCREEEMQVECLEELNGTSRSLVQEPIGPTQEESVTMNCEHALDMPPEGAKVIGEVSETENKEGEVSVDHGKVEIPRNDGVVEEGNLTLEDSGGEGRIEANNKEDENQQKLGQEDEARKVNEVEDSCEQNDALMEEANHEEERQLVITAKQGKSKLPTAVDVVKEACREGSFERNEMDVEKEAYKRLGEKQTEACCNIVALKKMLKQCTRSKQQNEAVLAHNNSFGVRHDDVRFGSLPLSKESCKQLWKLVHKIQGELFEIIDSFDNIEVSNDVSQGCEEESMRKGLFQEGPKRMKSPCMSNKSEKTFSSSKQLEQKKGEIGSQTKVQVKETSGKRTQDVEAPELVGSFREQKQRKLCDGQAFPSLVLSGRPWDSSVSGKKETGCQSAEAVGHFCSGGELICTETTQLEKNCQREKLDVGAEKQDPIGEMQTRGRRHNQVALQIEASNRRIAEPSTSQSKPNVEDGHKGSEQKNA